MAVLVGFLAFGVCYARTHHAFFETGTVRFISDDGGFWGILGDSGRRYEPVYLAEELQKDGLRVWIKFKALPGGTGPRGWGAFIQILGYRVTGE